MTGRCRCASVALAVPIAALLSGCGRERVASAARTDATPAPRSVRIAPAESSTLPRIVSVSGTLAAEQELVLGPLVGGRVEQVLVDLGSRVERGQVLARLAPVDFELKVRQAEAALEQARARLGLAPGEAPAEVEPAETALVREAAAVRAEASVRRDRARLLWEQRLLTRSELDAAQASHEVAEARYQTALDEVRNRQALVVQRAFELDLARQQLRDSVLRAPFAGAVRERLASEGQYVSAGQPVVRLVQLHPLRLRVAVPERQAADLREGHEVRLSIENDPVEHTGRVVRLSPAIDESSRTLMVEAEVPNPDGRIRPGAFAAARIVTNASDPVTLVPESALVVFAGIEKVIGVAGGKAVERRVRTGRRDAGRVEVVEGIEPGDSVVVEPGSLAGGEPVAVID